MHLDYFAALRTAYATLDGKLGLSSVTVFQGGALPLRSSREKADSWASRNDLRSSP